MNIKHHVSQITAILASLVLLASNSASASFVELYTVLTQVTEPVSGTPLDVYVLYARFNSPNDRVEQIYAFHGLSGSVLNAFYHKDNATSGLLSQSSGTWSPTVTGSASTNAPYDSYVTIAALPTLINNTQPNWEQPLSWNRPSLPAGNCYWNIQPPVAGVVGQAGSASDSVRIGQFVLPRGFCAGSFAMNVCNSSPSSPYVTESYATFSMVPTWFRDLDGDGFGASASGVATQCTAPSGYVLNSTDCNDANPVINPTTVWFRDTDGDGFGASASGTATQCTAPSGFVLNSTDCNDANPAINPATVWFRDTDGDGFGASASGTATQCTAPSGFVLNNTDCNDANPAINPTTVWFRDSDGDGFGVAAEGTIQSCTLPTGYSLINGDNCTTIANANQADINANGVGDACEIARGDLNLDGVVGGADVPLLLNAWGSLNPTSADINRDGIVNGQDFSILLSNWGTTV